jgi:hypothetical protein
MGNPVAVDLQSLSASIKCVFRRGHSSVGRALALQA